MISSKFQHRINDLAANAAFMEKALSGELNSKWLCTLFSQNEGIIDLTKSEEIQTKFFDRKDLDTEIQKAYTDADSQLSDFNSAAAQVEFMCALQREFMQRHRSRLSIMATQVARTVIHGGSDGVIQGGIMKMVTQFAKQGGQ